MGAVNFDPTPWLDGDDGHVEAAKVANPAKVAAVEVGRFAALAALAPSASTLPAAIKLGLSRLKSEPGPLTVREPDVWCEIVADAVRIGDSGMGARLLAGGWPPLRIWGVSHVPGGDPALEGLAVWLAGRDLAVVVEGEQHVAVARDARGGTERFVCNDAVTEAIERDAADVAFLWELAAIQRRRTSSAAAPAWSGGKPGAGA